MRLEDNGLTIVSQGGKLMTNENRLSELRCGTGQMMFRLYERPSHDAGLSIWVCPGCGALAVHIESYGDIMWYGPSAKTRVDESWSAGFAADGTHLAKCTYCPERFTCSCGRPVQEHMCDRCNDAAEDSKMAAPKLAAGDTFPTGFHWPRGTEADPGEAAAENAVATEYQDEDDSAKGGGPPW